MVYILCIKLADPAELDRDLPLHLSIGGVLGRAGQKRTGPNKEILANVTPQNFRKDP
jgi:hypothetical protein